MLLTGAVGGSVNATIITGMQLGNSFIITLGTLYAFQSLSYIVSSGGGQIQGLPEAILKLANGSVIGIPAPVFLVAGCVLCMSIMLKKTVWGRWIVAIGGNREAAERIGIPTRRVVGSVYIFAGLMAGAGRAAHCRSC